VAQGLATEILAAEKQLAPAERVIGAAEKEHHIPLMLMLAIQRQALVDVAEQCKDG
jgi:hypothetical protein